MRAQFHKRRCALVYYVFTGFFGVTPVAAQAPPATAQGTAPDAALGVTPPILEHAPAADVPESVVLEEPLAVDLELTITEQGRVLSARVLSSPSELLAERALENAKQFLFEPARQGETPISVVVEYRYWFRPPVPDPAPSAAATATPPRKPHVAAAPPSAAAAPTPPEPAAAAAALAGEEEEFEAIAEVAAPPREATRRSLEKEVLTRVPGTRGDAIRSIEILPGVARAPQGQDPLIRGGAQTESLALLDGTPVPLLYHFGGLTSVIQGGLLEQVDLYPGNFSARYGRATAGVIEAQLRDPATDALHGALDLSLLDSSARLEAPIGEQLAIAVGARRSNIDAVFDAFVPEGSFQVVAAPVYWDYQAIVNYRPNAQHRLRLAAIGARDEIALLFDEPNAEDPTLRGALDLSQEFHKLQLLYETQLAQVQQRITLAFGRQDLNQVLGPDVRAFFNIYDLDVRSETEFSLSENNVLSVGFDLTHQTLLGAYRGSVASAAEGGLPYDARNRDEVVVPETYIYQTAPALYVEARLFPTEAWQLTPGLRLDYYHQLDALTVNPRLSQRYQWTEDTTLKSGIGFYSEPPLYYESFHPIGNPEVNPYHSIHTSVGVEQELGESLELDVEGFYKSLYDRVVGTEDSAAPFFVNGGKGRIYGLEVGATFAPSRTSFAQLSYTWSRSERQDHSAKWRLFDYDQPHNFSLAAGHSWESGWELGLRFRAVSGSPHTPVTRAVYDAGGDVYTPIFGPINSARDQMFHQLDLRVEKRFFVGPTTLAIYLDIQNVYNQENPEGYGYSYDYSKQENAAGLPFFPNLGLRGEL